MLSMNCFKQILALGAVAPFALCAQMISVEELANEMVGDTPPVLIDIRRSHSYEKGHIPGAINLPMPLIESRRLPRLGDVIVYCDGLAEFDVVEAMNLLREKPGLEPRALRGGFAAWETRSGVTTASSGFDAASDGGITYETLESVQGRGTVIYDLRQGDGGSVLKEHFPQARVVKGDPLKKLAASSGGGGTQKVAVGEEGNPLLREVALDSSEIVVLIDDDGKSATEAARRLRAGGLKRVVVLTGGDQIVTLEGRSGLERKASSSITVSEENLVDLQESVGGRE